MGAQGIQWEPADQQQETIRQQDLGKTTAIAPDDKLPASVSCDLSRPYPSPSSLQAPEFWNQTR